jgi:hypothetical protein
MCLDYHVGQQSIKIQLIGRSWTSTFTNKLLSLAGSMEAAHMY